MKILKNSVFVHYSRSVSLHIYFEHKSVTSEEWLLPITYYYLLGSSFYISKLKVSKTSPSWLLQDNIHRSKIINKFDQNI